MINKNKNDALMCPDCKGLGWFMVYVRSGEDESEEDVYPERELCQKCNATGQICD